MQLRGIDGVGGTDGRKPVRKTAETDGRKAEKDTVYRRGRRDYTVNRRCSYKRQKSGPRKISRTSPYHAFHSVCKPQVSETDEKYIWLRFQFGIRHPPSSSPSSEALNARNDKQDNLDFKGWP